MYTMEYTRTQEMKFGMEVQVCTILAYRLLRTWEIAMAKMAGSTEKRMFSREITSVLRRTRRKSPEPKKIRSKYFKPTNWQSQMETPGV